MNKIPFSDLRLMSLLPKALAKHLEPQELEEVYASLRESLFEGYAQPSPEPLWATVSKCRRCPNRSGNADLPMWNIKDPKVLFISEKKIEMKSSISIFMEAMKKNDFSSSDVCLSWMVRCPFKDKHTEDDLSRCSEYMWTEIAALSPSVIVPMGSKPASFFLPVEKLAESRGNTVWVGPWRICPTFSPDYVAMAESDKITQEFTDDLRKIRNLIK